MARLKMALLAPVALLLQRLRMPAKLGLLGALLMLPLLWLTLSQLRTLSSDGLKIEMEQAPIGGAGYDAAQDPLPAATLARSPC